MVGLDKVTRVTKVDAGRVFYLRNETGPPALWAAALFTNAGQTMPFSVPLADHRQADARFRALHTGNVGDHELAAVLPEVDLRVDATSIANTAFSGRPRVGEILVRGSDARLVVALHGDIGLYSFASGEIDSADMGVSWMTFSRWSLFVAERFADRVIVSHDAEQ